MEKSDIILFIRYFFRGLFFYAGIIGGLCLVVYLLVTYFWWTAGTLLAIGCIGGLADEALTEVKRRKKAEKSEG